MHHYIRCNGHQWGQLVSICVTRLCTRSSWQQAPRPQAFMASYCRKCSNRLFWQNLRLLALSPPGQWQSPLQKVTGVTFLESRVIFVAVTNKEFTREDCDSTTHSCAQSSSDQHSTEPTSLDTCHERQCYATYMAHDTQGFAFLHAIPKSLSQGVN